MFRTKPKDEIGSYLTVVINNKYKSNRQFCKEYLLLRYEDEPEDSDIQNMANRVCQILKGNKEIQIEDLPIFSELLEISIEDILSAGTYSTPSCARTTNYSIAYSKDKEEWDKYINRADKLILNPDEYNKTVIEYALDAGNYSLLKYLMEKKYIWFVSEDQKDYVLGFGAGTSIKRRQVENTDNLNVLLKESDELRYKMIALAINNSDIEMLKALHAREIPDLYNITNVLHANFNKALPETKAIKSMVKSIASGNNTVIDYFFEEYNIESNFGSKVNTFVFPYSNLLLAELVKSYPNKAKRYLIMAIKYNKSVNDKLIKAVDISRMKVEVKRKLLQQDIDSFPELKEMYEKNTRLCSWQDYYFYPANGFMSYIDLPNEKNGVIEGFITNVMYAGNVKSTDKKIQELLNELNATYMNFKKYLLNKEQ